jgi:hypothetical protein
MADYLLKGDAFIDGVRRFKGERVSFDGTPSQVMQALQSAPNEGQRAKVVPGGSGRAAKAVPARPVASAVTEQEG